LQAKRFACCGLPDGFSVPVSCWNDEREIGKSTRREKIFAAGFGARFSAAQ
jgi:hypothetical protein